MEIGGRDGWKVNSTIYDPECSSMSMGGGWEVKSNNLECNSTYSGWCRVATAQGK